MSWSIHLLLREISRSRAPEQKQQLPEKGPWSPYFSPKWNFEPSTSFLAKQNWIRIISWSFWYQNYPGNTRTRDVGSATPCSLCPWTAGCVTDTQKPDCFDRKVTRRVSYPVSSPGRSPYDVWFFVWAKEPMKNQILRYEDNLGASWQRSERTLIETPSMGVLRVRNKNRMHNNTRLRIFHRSTLTKRELH
jgi:hypothetical protein